jgi:anti-sigma B factor antagonist
MPLGTARCHEARFDLAAMPPFTSRVEDGALSVEGDLDLYTTPLMLATAKQHLPPAHPVTLNLRHVEFMDSVGMSALLQLRRRAGDTNTAVTLLHVRPAVRRLFELTGIDALFTLVD